MNTEAKSLKWKEEERVVRSKLEVSAGEELSLRKTVLATIDNGIAAMQKAKALYRQSAITVLK
ncbi:predicted protein [Botrytis cinerea T4]|uniref:Uncharacterized protein n=1 Tax=Botryotinia fuckeliana (strain T4) TaxID=999810 RepID=G2XT92_BOTF4|nr:predicted protein [Botrytis cinerea T4]